MRSASVKNKRVLTLKILYYSSSIPGQSQIFTFSGKEIACAKSLVVSPIPTFKFKLNIIFNKADFPEAIRPKSTTFNLFSGDDLGIF